MSFTYDVSAAGFPSPRDTVRQLLGDTRNGTHQVEDEEIDAVLAELGSDPYRVAVGVLDRILLPRVSRQVDEDTAGIRTSRSQLFTQLSELRARLVDQAPGLPRAMLGSRSEIEAELSDEDWRGPGVRRSTGLRTPFPLDDYPGGS